MDISPKIISADCVSLVVLDVAHRKYVQEEQYQYNTIVPGSYVEMKG